MMNYNICFRNNYQADFKLVLKHKKKALVA